MSDTRANVSEDDEQRLRELLERAAPHLSAPAQRMASVRLRVVRRRRRRAAGLAAAAVTAAALTYLGAPSGPASDERARVAAPPQAGKVVFLPLDPVFGGSEGLGVALTLPSGWYAQGAQPGYSPVGYVADSPLGTHLACARQGAPAFDCAPQGQLPVGGTLVEFELTPWEPGFGETAGKLDLVRTDEDDMSNCRKLGGVSQFTTTVMRVRDQQAALRANVCLAPRTAGNERAEPGAEVRALLASARLALEDRSSAPPPSASQENRPPLMPTDAGPSGATFESEDGWSTSRASDAEALRPSARE
ncbi:hypothetical protein FB570_111240 [Streptomyces sp. T12]|uniref:hypothetical protein n=1 Tax=Streptomyces sp. T12 TaxID=477697 RepID=UPI0011A8FB5E|nr:hypothetical protein [Streptomyces sp. T12]TWD17627.1 hypothetical protein FB570_111240 [Streptomyces sp. T12]